MDAFSPDQLLRRLTQFLTETKPLLENMDCLMTVSYTHLDFEIWN